MSTPTPAPQPGVAASASGPATGPGEPTQSFERTEEASVHPSPERGEPSVNPWAVSTGVLSAGLVATGVVGLVGSRRRRRLERAPLRAVAPVPDPDLAPIERAARLGANPAAAARVDAALRALAAAWGRTEAALRPLALRRHRSGDLALTLAGPARPTAPWRATDRADVWTLPADVPLGELVSQACGVPSPCPALVLLGVDADSELYVDLEALGTLVIDGPPEAARAIARAVVASLAVSPLADRVQVVAAGADCYGFANHGRVQAVADAGAALEVAGCLVGPVQRALDAERVPSTLALRARQPAELWEPTVVVALAAASDPVDAEALASMAGQGGRGLALVTDVPVPGATWRLRLDGDRWALDPLAGAVAPQGLAADELADLGALLVDASAPLPEPPIAVPELIPPDPYRERAGNCWFGFSDRWTSSIARAAPSRSSVRRAGTGGVACPSSEPPDTFGCPHRLVGERCPGRDLRQHRVRRPASPGPPGAATRGRGVDRADVRRGAAPPPARRHGRRAARGTRFDARPPTNPTTRSPSLCCAKASRSSATCPTPGRASSGPTRAPGRPT